MNKIILRDFSRTEHDDFLLNIEPQLKEKKEALPIYAPDSGNLLGWKIQNQYE